MLAASQLPPALRKNGIAERLARICQENDVVFLAIFGSFVNGKPHKKSDVDILIRYKEGTKKTLFDLVELGYKLRRVFGRKVDLVEVGGLTNKYIREEVLSSIKVIYEEG